MRVKSVHSRSALLAIASVMASFANVRAETIRIGEYNIDCSDQGNNNAVESTGGIPSVIQAMGQQTLSGNAQPVDVLTLTELLDTNNNSITSTTLPVLVNSLNALYGTNIYAYATTPDPTTGGAQYNGPSGLIYDQNVVKVIGAEALPYSGDSGYTEPRAPMRYELQPIGYGSNADFYVYVSHTKSGESSSDQSERASEATAIRVNEASIGGNPSVIYTGDLNSSAQQSGETEFKIYTGTSPNTQGSAYDPTVDSNNPSSFSQSISYYSESTTNLEYRDDYELLTSNVMSDAVGSALQYVNGSFEVFGNNGTTSLHGKTNASGNTSLNDLSDPATIKNDLMQPAGSDHLPIEADYQIGVSPAQSIPTTLYWNNSSGDNLWDINTSANWNDAADSVNPAMYQENGVSNDNVVFDDPHNVGVNASYNVTLNTTVNPQSVTVNNSAGNYVISGTGNIAGATGVTKFSTASLTLDTTNTYTGTTLITAGSLSLGTSGSIADSATINVSSGATFNVSNLAGYTLGASASQTLEGTGNVNGNITIGANGTLSPGIPSSNTIGALTVDGSVTLTAGSNISAQVTPTSGVNDELIAASNVYLGNANGVITSTGVLTNGESFTVIQGNVYGWFNNNGGGLPALSAGFSWNAPLQINNSLVGAANTYQQNIVLSVTNGTPIYGSNLPAADTYAGFNISEQGGGRGTQVTFLGGTVSTATSLSIQFSAAPADATHLISDYATVNGTNSDIYVLELSYSNAQLGGYQPTSPVLAVDSNGTLESAVLLNSGGLAKEILGAYTTADFSLGDYGVDPTNDVVWAVLNYSGGAKFGVSSRLAGDAAGTGQVTPQDISIVLSNQGVATNLWSLGDFNNTNSVTPQDISQVLAAQGNTAIGTSEGGVGLIHSSPVPEPDSLAFLALAGLGLIIKRRKPAK